MSDLKSAIAAQIEAGDLGQVWVPPDFAQLGKRDAIDKTLQRMVQGGHLRRIDRGLYDKPTFNKLTKCLTYPDYCVSRSNWTLIPPQTDQRSHGKLDSHSRPT